MAVLNAPTPEYRRHHPVEAPVVDEAHFRPHWRRVDRLDKLLTDGLIGRREYLAALAFRALYELAHRGPGGLRAQNLDAVRVDKNCRRPAPLRTERQAAALARLQVITKSLGALFPLLEWAVIEEQSWCLIGRRLRVDPRTAKTWAVAAIAGLAAL